MTVKIKPNPEQLSQLLRCAELDSGKLADLVIHLGQLSETPLVPEHLLSELKTLLSEEDAELLLSQILSLSMLVRVSESKSVDVMKALRVAMSSEDQQAEWDSIAGSMQGLVDSTPVRLVTKAMS
ncbi:MAG: hypothetical protein R3C05_07315 [Pirellulaceae bacterium]